MLPQQATGKYMPDIPMHERHPSVLHAGKRIEPSPEEIIEYKPFTLRDLYLLENLPILPEDTAPRQRTQDEFSVSVLSSDPDNESIYESPMRTNEIYRPYESVIIQHERNKDKDPGVLTRVIDDLHTSTSSLIAPYLLDRLYDLDLLEHGLDYDLLQGNLVTPELNATEKVNRIQWTLDVLRRIINQSSERLVREKEQKER